MKPFAEWLLFREALSPLEVNHLFNAQLSVVIPSARMSGGLSDLNFSSYILAALRNVGFTTKHDLDEHLHAITIKLLVSPGKLFAGYDPTRHGALEYRFKKSVKNAILNILEKERTRRRFVPLLGDVPDYRSSPQQQDLAFVDQFRQLVRQRLGDSALAVLDARLNGVPMKSLGSSHSVKAQVRQIKNLARDFATTTGDPAFQRDIERAFQSERATVEKRRATVRGA